jgi:Acetyltransferase (GNAT) domain
MAEIELRTERLVLRRMRLDDVAAMHAVLSDPQAMQFWSHLPFAEVAESEAWVRQTIDETAAGEADDFAITCDGEVIGKMSIRATTTACACSKRSASRAPAPLDAPGASAASGATASISPSGVSVPPIPSCPALCRASTLCGGCTQRNASIVLGVRARRVDGRHKAGHDDDRYATQPDTPRESGDPEPAPHLLRGGRAWKSSSADTPGSPLSRG